MSCKLGSLGCFAHARKAVTFFSTHLCWPATFHPCRPPARPSSSLLSKLNRVQQGGYADSASRYTGYSRLK